MASVPANGIRIEYESFGAEGAETVLLIMGHSGQLTMWPVQLCEDLVRRGYRVVRYDNRDVGLSTKLDAAGLPDWEKIRSALAIGAPPPIAYSLDDMARDAVGLLDALGIERAHIVGASLGGMIAHLVAADFPERTLSLTSIMCTASNPDIPIITEEAIAVLGAPVPTGDRDALIDHQVRQYEWRQSPGYPTPREEIRRMILADLARCDYPAGSARQGAASATAYDRRPKLRTIGVPTVVVHGQNDPAVPLAGARDIAACVPGAELRIIPGMGHDFPVALAPIIADAIASAADRARANQPA